MCAAPSRLARMANFDGEQGCKMVISKACVLFHRAMLIPKAHLAFEKLALRQEVTVSKQLATSRSTRT